MLGGRRRGLDGRLREPCGRGQRDGHKRMPHLDGLEALPRLVAAPRAPRIIVLTTFDLDDYVFEALERGANGFLLEGAPADQLLAGIRAAGAGDALIDASVTRRLIARVLAKLGLRDRVQAVILAYEAGLVTPGVGTAGS